MSAMTSAEIRAAREAAGWSIAEAARALKRSSPQPLPPVTTLVRAWKRWEHGTEPSRLYGPLLLRLLSGTSGRAGDVETIDVFTERAAVPRETWLSLIGETRRHLDLLAFAATFFHQLTSRISARLAAAADRGAEVRLCFADPKSPALAVREAEEELLDADLLATKVRTSLGYFRPLLDHDGCEIRLHRATVYASLFRFDDELLANPHVYSAPANANPLLHLRPSNALFAAYTASFEATWSTATRWTGEAV
jgi:hypothetical protein